MTLRNPRVHSWHVVVTSSPGVQNLVHRNRVGGTLLGNTLQRSIELGNLEGFWAYQVVMFRAWQPAIFGAVRRLVTVQPSRR